MTESSSYLALPPWWEASVAADIVIAVAYLCIAFLILEPLTRHRQLRTNQLATVTAAIFVSSAVVYGLQALQPLLFSPTGPDGRPEASAATPGWVASWHLLTACVAVCYLGLRRWSGTLHDRAPLFEDLQAKERVFCLEELAAAAAERDAAQEERDAYAHMLRSIIENSQSAIYVKDLEGRYLMCNPRLIEFMGLTEPQILGQTDDVLKPALAAARRASDARAQEGRFEVDEWDDAFDDGQHLYQSVKFPLYDEAGDLYATCGISLDLTDQKCFVQAIAQRDAALAATAAKSAFLATMSHEIRTPMNAVIGMTDLLIETDLDEQQREFAELVRSSGHSLLSVINDILDYSKIESGELLLEATPFDLIDEIEGCLDVVSVSATERNLGLLSYVDRNCPSHVVGDPGRLRQIVVNLLSNAVKFTHAGEILVTVTSKEQEDGRLQVSVSVADTGIGIAEDALEALFKSFTQVDASTTRIYGGTGLGLAISQRLAEAMGGELTVTSTPGVGSTFTAVVLMGQCADSDKVESVAKAAAPDLVGRSALLVDDNDTNLRILDLQLTNVGMHCTTVSSPAEALELVSAGQSYDLAVLDLNMPQMDGVELGQALKDLTSSSMPLVLLASIGTRPPAARNTFSSMLTKPIKSGVLRRAISSVLSDEAELHAQTCRSSASAEPNALRVLLAEDNLVNQRVARLTLANMGFEVDIVDNGRAAVEAVLETSYDVVLMDMQMPEMDGLAATREIRRLLPEERQPKIIAMTASVLAEDQAACADAGMDDYLAKPVRGQVLRAALDDRVAPHPRLPAAEVAAEVTPQRALQPAIDETALRLLAEQLGDDIGAQREVLSSYLDEGGVSMKALLSAAVESDAKTVLSVAHSLRSTSVIVGARGLADTLLGAEAVARSTPEKLPTLVSILRSEYERVETALRATMLR